MKANSYLLDSCVLIALCDIDHLAHRQATDWFESTGGNFATCPITQLALLRYALRVNRQSSFQEAKKVLKLISSMPGHEFWDDSIDCRSLPAKGILAHGHLTDSYLVTLALSKGCRIATLDRRMADVYSPTALFLSYPAS